MTPAEKLAITSTKTRHSREDRIKYRRNLSNLWIAANTAPKKPIPLLPDSKTVFILTNIDAPSQKDNRNMRTLPDGLQSANNLDQMTCQNLKMLTMNGAPNDQKEMIKKTKKTDQYKI